LGKRIVMRIKKNKNEEVVETPVVVQEEPKKPVDNVKIAVDNHLGRLKKKHGKK
jgi:hypothetical protein